MLFSFHVKKIKYDIDINVRDFIKSILIRNLPMTVADDMGKNEMIIRKALCGLCGELL